MFWGKAEFADVWLVALKGGTDQCQDLLLLTVKLFLKKVVCICMSLYVHACVCYVWKDSCKHTVPFGRTLLCKRFTILFLCFHLRNHQILMNQIVHTMQCSFFTTSTLKNNNQFLKSVLFVRCWVRGEREPSLTNKMK